MSEEMKLSELCQMADERQRQQQLLAAAMQRGTDVREVIENMRDDPFERGYAAGYARAQQDIRMALGCKA
jgi:hypothetical protein